MMQVHEVIGLRTEGHENLSAKPAQEQIAEQIANLARRMAEAERKISELNMKVKAHIRRIQAMETDTKTMLEYIALLDEGDKSVNESGSITVPLSRTAVIWRAKTDVYRLIKSTIQGVPVIGGGQSTYSPYLGDRVEFVINRDKRTIVALIHGNALIGSVWARGIAKCAPDDCFNVHIGKAIALRRALGLDVPDYYANAPQPTEPKPGDIVKWTGNGNIEADILTIKGRYYPGYNCDMAAYEFTDGEWDFVNTFQIIDDTGDFGGKDVPE